MIWIFVAIIAAYLVYYFLSGDIRKASKVLAYSLNVKPTMVVECISAMRKDPSVGVGTTSRQQFYCRSVVGTHGNLEQLGSLVKVFYIYQVLKNPHDQNVLWWSERMKDCGFDSQISALDRQTFESFFDVEHSSFKDFTNAHNKMLI
ncbi:DUF1198 family protein [Shewanella nanhaiensis]|nr:DUF1198 family protein [Shewanella nanhaiensis]